MNHPYLTSAVQKLYTEARDELAGMAVMYKGVLDYKISQMIKYQTAADHIKNDPVTAAEMVAYANGKATPTVATRVQAAYKNLGIA